MGIQCIESVTYSVDDLATCVRFFTDFGLTLSHADDSTAAFTTLAGQTLRLHAKADRLTHPAVEAGPTVREVVWGVDNKTELERLADAVASDRDLELGDDGVLRSVDQTGFGLGLTVTCTVEPEVREVKPGNRWDSVGRLNDSVGSVLPVRPIRMCHVALNIPKAGADEAVAFYVDRLGFVPTDIVKPMGTFMRCEGDADQHNLLLSHRPDRAGINHVSYEVASLDDVVEGGNHMVDRGWTESRRLGRHVVGSNIFRFFQAPCGGRVELAADMDRVDESYGVRVHETSPGHHIWTLRSNRDAAASETRP